MQQLTPQDAQFLFMETGSYLSHVTITWIYDPTTSPSGEVSFEDVVNHVRSRLHTSALFKRRLYRVPLDFDYPYWVEDEYFDIEHHIHQARLPDPGDWTQLCAHLARYHSRPMDMQRPLWEMRVVEGLDKISGIPKGSFALATKIHHCTIDGASSMKFMSALSDLGSEGVPAREVPSVDLSGLVEPSLSSMARRAFLSNIRSPVRMGDALLRTAPTAFIGARKLLQRTASSGKSQVPDTRFNGAVSPHKNFDATLFSIDDFRQIKNTVAGAKVNDVVLALCSGALRRYLSAHDELPAESLVAWCPINARARGSSEDDIPGNDISAMAAQIHTEIAEPLACLRAVHATTSRTKEAKDGVSARLMADITKSVSATTQVLASRLIVQAASATRMCNLFVSNVAGPQHPMYMSGARLIADYALAPVGDGMGLFIATLSFDDKISFSVTSTREIMPDIEFFMDCVRESFTELQASAMKKTGRSTGKKKAVKPRTRSRRAR